MEMASRRRRRWKSALLEPAPAFISGPHVPIGTISSSLSLATAWPSCKQPPLHSPAPHTKPHTTMLHLPLSFPGWERDLLSDFMAMPGYPSCRGSACAAPLLYPAAAAAAPIFRVLRAAPAFPEPEEPEVYIRRTEEGVLAACPLGHGFSRDDIRWVCAGAAAVLHLLVPSGTSRPCLLPWCSQ